MIVQTIETDPPQPTGLDEIPGKLVFYPGNTTALYLLGVMMLAVPPADPPVDTPALTATIKVTLNDATGTPVTGFNALPFSLVGSPSAGDYVAVIPESVNPPIGGDYTLVISGSEGTDYLNLSIPVEVMERTS